LPENTPTEKVVELQQTGKTNTEIIQDLQTEGYSFQQISDALNQAQAKMLIEGVPPSKKEEMQPSVIYSEETDPSNKETEEDVLEIFETPEIEHMFSQLLYRSFKLFVEGIICNGWTIKVAPSIS